MTNTFKTKRTVITTSLWVLVILFGLIMKYGYKAEDSYTKGSWDKQFASLDLSPKGILPTKQFREIETKSFDRNKYYKDNPFTRDDKFKVRDVRQSDFKGTLTLMIIAPINKNSGGNVAANLAYYKKYLGHNKNYKSAVVRLNRRSEWTSMFSEMINIHAKCYQNKSWCFDNYYEIKQFKNDLHYKKMRQWVANVVKQNEDFADSSENNLVTLILDKKGQIRFRANGNVTLDKIDYVMGKLDSKWKPSTFVYAKASRWEKKMNTFEGGMAKLEPLDIEVARNKVDHLMDDLPEILGRLKIESKKIDGR